ncbi:hypothetical protein HYT25_01470 [Candidatus Pacearchaeota archaeon]|nr:hypothetical protein [Candidatus Pacearchaeota archaeon]
MSDTLRNELVKLRSIVDLVEFYDLMREDSREEKLRKMNDLYLFGETSDNEEANFLSARKLLDKGLTECVFASSAPKGNGYPGFDSWSNNLKIKYNITLLPIDFSDNIGINTLNESEALVKYIRYSSKNDLSLLYLIAPQFHLLRAFMTASSVVIRENPDINFFAYPGEEQDWDKVVRHSQGTTIGRRIDLVKGEVERIQKYTSKGDIESITRIIDYMAHRK